MAPIVASIEVDRPADDVFAYATDPTRFVDRSLLPTGGQIHACLKGGAFDAEAYDRERADRYARREGFY